MSWVTDITQHASRYRQIFVHMAVKKHKWWAMGVWWGVRWWQGGREGHREPFCSLWCIWSLVTSAKTVLAPGLLEFHYWSGAVQNWWGRFNTQLINPIHPFAFTVNITMIMVISSKGTITIMVTRSYAALRAADLDWIVGPGCSPGG